METLPLRGGVREYCERGVGHKGHVYAEACVTYSSRCRCVDDPLVCTEFAERRSPAAGPSGDVVALVGRRLSGTAWRMGHLAWNAVGKRFAGNRYSEGAIMRVGVSMWSYVSHFKDGRMDVFSFL